jgi:broad specificity phosphatase PhoE
VNDIKEPSTEATALGGKFYSEVWKNDGRKISDETIRQNEEETHRASEEARRAVEDAEREKRIGMFVSHSIFVSALASYLTKLYFIYWNFLLLRSRTTLRPIQP